MKDSIECLAEVINQSVNLKSKCTVYTRIIIEKFVHLFETINTELQHSQVAKSANNTAYSRCGSNGWPQLWRLTNIYLMKPNITIEIVWVKEVWESIPTEMVWKSFLKSWMQWDGSEDYVHYPEGDESTAENETESENWKWWLHCWYRVHTTLY